MTGIPLIVSKQAFLFYGHWYVYRIMGFVFFWQNGAGEDVGKVFFMKTNYMWWHLWQQDSTSKGLEQMQEKVTGLWMEKKLNQMRC